VIALIFGFVDDVAPPNDHRIDHADDAGDGEQRGAAADPVDAAHGDGER
jgi:hypothetical protein